jgi:hypothetical protein
VSSGAPRHKHVQLPARRPISLASAYLVRVTGARGSSGVGWSAIIFIASDNHISYTRFHIYIYMPRPYLYFIHLATTSDPMRWRGSSAEHMCWRRPAVRWAWGRTGPFRRVPVTTPSPSNTRSVLVLAAVGALQLRRSRRDSDTSKCAKSACKRTYRYHLWLLS